MSLFADLLVLDETIVVGWKVSRERVTAHSQLVFSNKKHPRNVFEPFISPNKQMTDERKRWVVFWDIFEWLIFFKAKKKLNFSSLESLDFDWVQFTSTVWRLPGSFQWCRANYGEHIARLCQHEAKTNSKLVFLLLVSSPPVWKCIIALAMCSIICIDAMGFCTQTMVFHRRKASSTHRLARLH